MKWLIKLIVVLQILFLLFLTIIGLLTKEYEAIVFIWTLFSGGFLTGKVIRLK